MIIRLLAFAGVAVLWLVAVTPIGLAALDAAGWLLRDAQITSIPWDPARFLVAAGVSIIVGVLAAEATGELC